MCGNVWPSVSLLVEITMPPGWAGRAHIHSHTCTRDYIQRFNENYLSHGAGTEPVIDMSMTGRSDVDLCVSVLKGGNGGKLIV